MPIHSETIEMIAINAGFNPSMKAGRGGGIAPPWNSELPRNFARKVSEI